jgi:hypothetical protein
VADGAAACDKIDTLLNVAGREWKDEFLETVKDGANVWTCEHFRVLSACTNDCLCEADVLARAEASTHHGEELN